MTVERSTTRRPLRGEDALFVNWLTLPCRIRSERRSIAQEFDDRAVQLWMAERAEVVTGNGHERCGRDRGREYVGAFGERITVADKHERRRRDCSGIDDADVGVRLGDGRER